MGKSRHHKQKTPNFEQFRIPLIIILGIVLIVNISFMSGLNSGIDKRMKELELASMPAMVELLVLKDSSCDICFDIDAVVSKVKRYKVNITEERIIEYDSEEGKALIAKHGIEKIPAIVVTGEIDKAKIGIMDKKEDSLIFTNPNPPYIKTETGDIAGRVTVTYLTESSCTLCNDPADLVSQFKEKGVNIFKETIVSADSKYAQQLIKKYDIKKLPTTIFSKDLSEYTDITENWGLLGSVEDDGNFVLRTTDAIGIPYFDLDENKVIGLVEVIYLIDKSCDECYDVDIHRTILVQRFGAKLGKETRLDVSDEQGKHLIEKYNITSVPTVILSGDAGVYLQLRRTWMGVGTIEDDGSYIFRNMGAMQGSVYKDLATGEIKGK